VFAWFWWHGAPSFNDWNSDQVSALAAAVAAAVAAGGVIFVVLAAITARAQLEEVRNARYAPVAIDFSRRWDEAVMLPSRQLARKSPEAVRDALLASFNDLKTDDYLILQVAPNYFEDLAILLRQGIIEGRFAEDSLGAVLRDAWYSWHLAADALRGEDEADDPWPHFRSAGGTQDLTTYARRTQRSP
jgi:hypothetical protein